MTMIRTINFASGINDRMKLAAVLDAYDTGMEPEDIVAWVTSAHCIVLDDYESDCPGYCGPVYIVIGGGGPDDIITFTVCADGKVQVNTDVRRLQSEAKSRKAAEALLDAYAWGEEDEHIEWNDLDEAHRLAKEALPHYQTEPRDGEDDGPPEEWHPKKIKFKTDRNNKVFALGWRVLAQRWVKMNLEEAQLLISTGRAEESK